jgi:hypothetical protein
MSGATGARMMHAEIDPTNRGEPMHLKTITLPRAALALTATLAVAALALTLPAAGTAAKAPNLTFGTYEVKIEGTQKTTWTLDHVLEGHCDSNSNGSGSETVRFKSKPTRLKAYFGLSDPVTFFSGSKKNPGGLPTIALNSRITRDGTINHWGGEPCSYGDGTGVAPTPDCGTKRGTMGVELGFDYPKKTRLVLDQTEIGEDPYTHCPSGGPQFPYLIEANTDRSHIGQILEPDEMMKAGQYIVLAQGSDQQTEGDSKYTTTIEWNVSFKRIGKLKGT